MFYSLRAAPPRPLINEDVLKVSVGQVSLMQSRRVHSGPQDRVSPAVPPAEAVRALPFLYITLKT